MSVLSTFTRRRASVPSPRTSPAEAPAPAAQAGEPAVHSDREVDIEIVVESYHEVAVRLLREQYGQEPFRITLVPQPDNPYDPHAVAVLAETGRVGHLPPALARAWQPWLLAAAAAGVTSTGTARVVGGTRGRPALGLAGSAVWGGEPGSAPASRSGGS